MRCKPTLIKAEFIEKAVDFDKIVAANTTQPLNDKGSCRNSLARLKKILDQFNY